MIVMVMMVVMVMVVMVMMVVIVMVMVTVTRWVVVWLSGLIFWSFLTKAKPDQAFPSHFHGKI